MSPTLTRHTALMAAVLTLGCGGGDGGTGPVAGPLHLTLTSPNSDDGAVMIQVTGDIDSVAVAAGLNLYQTTPGSSRLKAIITGDLESGSTLLTLYVPDVGEASTYTAEVLQVAAASSWSQRPLAGYGLVIQP